jgi:hypothetical protein
MFLKVVGSVRIKHTFYPNRDDKSVTEASLLGYLKFEAAKRTVKSLRLVTDQATYAGQRYTVAVRLLP